MASIKGRDATEITGPDAYREAQRKARYGHRNWIHWTDRKGLAHAAVKTPESVKACLLDCGSQKGGWTLIHSDGIGSVGFWWLGLNLIRQMKRYGIY